MTKQRKRSLRAAALACLEMELPREDELRQELERRGLAPTGGQALAYRQWMKAAGGDTSAAKFLRDAAGPEEPETPAAKPAADLSGLTDEELRHLAGRSVKCEQG
ncbi:hypothetical protein [Dysosmobacter sp.]|uniref:hypothetical protein n=1 Tax=Dysosmobacter sp. TaxID=2591382 RepID=UPI002A8B1FC0|nr:hypothetical protein [Dysosmobacter sp.]MDY3281690.1 hypothetical protein [Dysosmobacter sp.]